jgi:hypothetical protein
MTICGILGDSIALGLALAHPGCDTSAKVGRSTHAILAHQLPQRHYDYVVISAGSNNPRDPALLDQLSRIRATVTADKVVWIEPLNSERARSMVREIAAAHGDSTQGFAQSRDGVHPRSYSALWALVKRRLGLR